MQVGRKRKGKKRVSKMRKGRTTTTLTPARKKVWLKYVSQQSLGGGAHVGFAYPIYSNAAFAVDPSAPAGYTTTPGFSVPATQYAAYRVLRYRGKISFENTTAIPAQTIVCHSNTALGAPNGGGTAVDLLQFAANRPKVNTIKPIQGSGGGPNRVEHRFNHSVAFIAGETVNQPGYKSLTNTVPSILTYIVFGYVSAANLATMQMGVELEMLVEFLDYIDTLTSFQSEGERLAKLGTTEILKCAGCKAVEEIELLPCPDPNCCIVDLCSNCGFSRRCSMNCQSPRCPFRADTVRLIPPLVRKASSSKI